MSEIIVIQIDGDASTEIVQTASDYVIEIEATPATIESETVILAKGDKGDTGNSGPANVLTVGTVTTGASGSSVAITITGTTPAQIVNFTIPKGDKGDDGSPNVLTVGDVTTGAAGSPVSITITGATPAQVVNFTIPQGDKGDAGPNTVTTATDTNLTGLLYANGSKVSSVAISSSNPQPNGTAAPGTTGTVSDAGHVHPLQTVGTVQVLADVTLTATDLPSYSASADASTDVVTLTGKNPANGETYYIEGGTPPTITGGSYAFVNEWIGPVVYAVSSSGSTCKISATKGGAALDITNAGSGWTMRRAGLNKVQIAGLSESTAGKKYEIVAISPVGNNWDTVNAVSMRSTINNQLTSSYRNSTSEGSTLISTSNLGNVQGFSLITLEHCGNYLAGDYLQFGITGTDLTFANSVPKGSTNPIQCSYTLGTPIAISSIEFIDPLGTDFYTIKLGTRFIIRRIG